MSSIDEWAKARGMKPRLHPETAKNTNTPQPEPPKRPWKSYLPTFSPIWLVSFVLVASLGAGGYYYGKTLTTTKVVEKPVEKIVYRTKIKVVEKPVEKIVYKTKVKTVEKPVERVVYKDRVITKEVPDRTAQAKLDVLTAQYIALQQKTDNYAKIIDSFFNDPLKDGEKRKLIWKKRTVTDCPTKRVSY